MKPNSEKENTTEGNALKECGFLEELNENLRLLSAFLKQSVEDRSAATLIPVIKK